MCSHPPGVFISSVRSRWSSTLISIILSAIDFTFIFHSAKSSGSLRISETCCSFTHVKRHITYRASTRLTNRAPWAGGVLICVLIIDESFLHTLNAQSDVGQTMCNAPTRSAYNPAFFEKLC
jgi:hypothetical protein